MPAIARFLYITIDAQDAERIADFWAASPNRSRGRFGSSWTSVPPTW
jgi:hypothetical protein